MEHLWQQLSSLQSINGGWQEFSEAVYRHIEVCNSEWREASTYGDLPLDYDEVHKLDKDGKRIVYDRAMASYCIYMAYHCMNQFEELCAHDEIDSEEPVDYNTKAAESALKYLRQYHKWIVSSK